MKARAPHWMLLGGALALGAVGVLTGSWPWQAKCAAAPLLDVFVELRSEGAEVAFTPSAGAVHLTIELPMDLRGTIEVGPLQPAGRVAEAWRIDPDRRTEHAIVGRTSLDVSVLPGRAHAVRILPIPMAMGAEQMPRVHVRIEAGR